MPDGPATAGVGSARFVSSAARAAGKLIAEARALGGKVVRSAALRSYQRDRIAVDDHGGCRAQVYLMLNKPRGLVTAATTRRIMAPYMTAWTGSTCLSCRRSAVGKASENLLMTNDTREPADGCASHMPKTYHVQVGGAR
jgi:16S rRNA U516 pseudouridylate synthase RsuA-like enzyme